MTARAQVGVLPTIGSTRRITAVRSGSPNATRSARQSFQMGTVRTVPGGPIHRGLHSSPAEAFLGQTRQKGENGNAAAIPDIDPDSYYQSVFQSTCQKLLQEGCHRAFIELFQLIDRQKAEREEAGKDSGFYNDPLLKDEAEKLEYLQAFLMAAEKSLRINDLAAVYEAQLQLAQFFEESAVDSWLSDHFYQCCLETSKMMTTGQRRKEGEAHCNMGVALENQGNFKKAAEHFQSYYELATAADPPWYTTIGESGISLAATNLARVYTTLAEVVFEEDSNESIDYLQKALEYAKKVGAQTEGLAHYRLGNVFQSVGNCEKAVEHHRLYLEKSRLIKDDGGIAKACEALALAYESMGRLQDSVQYLEMLCEVLKRLNDHDALSHAYRSLGNIHNMLGEFDKSVSFYGQSYDIKLRPPSGKKANILPLEDPANVNTCRIEYGIARAHDLATFFIDNTSLAQQSVDEPQPGKVGLIHWKTSRATHGVVVLTTSASKVPVVEKEAGKHEGQERELEEAKEERSEENTPEEKAEDTWETKAKKPVEDEDAKTPGRATANEDS